MEINAYLEELSVHLQEKMSPVLSEYGIRLVHFYVNDISVHRSPHSGQNFRKF